jgi:transcriptional regulator with XRE-family HTH domain
MQNTINPQALRHHRAKQNLTQEALADAVGCRKDTISRWERGKSKKVRPRLRDTLCQTLHVDWDDLCRSPGEVSRPEAQLNLRINREARTALDLICIRYGIHRFQVINLAPLLFLILAERSLIERSRSINELEERTANVQNTLDNGLSHLGLEARATHEEEANPLDRERASIAARDIFGDETLFGFSEFDYRENPFCNYINELCRGLPEGAIGEMFSFMGRIEYSIAEDTLEQQTGLMGDREEDKPLLALLKDGSIDLAECRRMRRELDEVSYRSWLNQTLSELKDTCQAEVE